MKVYGALVSNGSLAYILYVSAFDKMEIRREKLKQVCTHLIGFKEECLILLGSKELLVTIGEPSHQVINKG